MEASRERSAATQISLLCEIYSMHRIWSNSEIGSAVAGFEKRTEVWHPKFWMSKKAKLPNTANLFLWPLTHPLIEVVSGTPWNGNWQVSNVKRIEKCTSCINNVAPCNDSYALWHEFDEQPAPNMFPRLHAIRPAPAPDFSQLQVWNPSVTDQIKIKYFKEKQKK